MEKISIDDLGKSILAVSPHDDDAVIGCGGLLSCAKSNDIYTSVVIMTDGRFGSPYVKKQDIVSKTVEVRRREARKAYERLGVDDIVFLNFPDMGLGLYKFFDIDRKEGRHVEGAYQKLLREVRRIKPETVLIPKCSDVREHVDHKDTHEISMFVCSFLTDHPIAYDVGDPVKIKNILEYEVWSKIEDSAYFGLPEPAQKLKRAVLSELKSQKRVIGELEIDWETEKYKLIELNRA